MARLALSSISVLLYLPRFGKIVLPKQNECINKAKHEAITDLTSARCNQSDQEHVRYNSERQPFTLLIRQRESLLTGDALPAFHSRVLLFNSIFDSRPTDVLLARWLYREGRGWHYQLFCRTGWPMLSERISMFVQWFMLCAMVRLGTSNETLFTFCECRPLTLLLSCKASNRTI